MGLIGNLGIRILHKKKDTKALAAILVDAKSYSIQLGRLEEQMTGDAPIISSRPWTLQGHFPPHKFGGAGAQICRGFCTPSCLSLVRLPNIQPLDVIGHHTNLEARRPKSAKRRCIAPTSYILRSLDPLMTISTTEMWRRRGTELGPHPDEPTVDSAVRCSGW